MIEVNEAVKIIENALLELPKVKIPLEKALGRVLKQEIVADTDLPPFDRVMMDGIAVKYEDVEKGVKTFHIQGVQGAGAPQMTLELNGNCLEVMTGAMIPLGADTVAPYEDIQIDTEAQIATIQIDVIIEGKNIHRKGTDKKIGDVLVSESVLIGAPEIAVAASVGLSEIIVTKNPSVAIVSTGNELVDVHETPLPHQIRRSNVYSIAAELQQFGIKSDLFHFNDEKDKLFIELKKVLEVHDLVILSGGVSKGKFDFIPDVLGDLGVKKMFHRIKQKPGKPFWFGVKKNQNVVFAFPGNPVSTFLCYHKYLVPWLNSSLGLNPAQTKKAALAEDFSVKTSLTYFLQVRTEIDDHGQLLAHPIVGKGSGDFANLLSSNAFLEMPEGGYDFKKGELFDLIPFKNI